MIDKTLKFTLALLLILTSFVPSNSMVEASSGRIIYFYEALCSGCQQVSEAGVLEALEDAGITVEIMDVSMAENIEIMASYSDFYGVRSNERSTPLMFAGGSYFSGPSDIIDALEDGSLIEAAYEDLLDVPDDYQALSGLSGLWRVMVAGLLDSINPCAIAMLLLFISMVAKIKSPYLLITISLSYISGIFITYFLIGLALLELMRTFAQEIAQVHQILYLLFAALSLFLAIITFYDVYVTKKKDYGKVKNQLPKGIKRFNKRFMERLTKNIQENSRSVKINAIIIPFIIGVVVAFTEAACTGQVYGLILLSIRSSEPVTGMIYLLIFNLLFVSPLIVISFIAVKTRNTTGIALFVQERLYLIKWLTAIFFLAMAVYFFINR